MLPTIPVDYSPAYNDPSDSWIPAIWNFFTSITGLSLLTSVVSGQGPSLDNAGWNVLPMLFLGSLVEVGRRLCIWFFGRFRFQHYITAQFTEGDPAYDWIILLLTNENIWKRSKDFRVTSKTSQRKWGIGLTKKGEEENAEYVPTYNAPQLWKWKGYWIEVTRNSIPISPFAPPMPRSYGGGPNQGNDSLFLTIYTFDMTVLPKLVEEARRKYYEVSKPFIMVHSIDSMQPSYGPMPSWNDVKKKARRPLESIILDAGVLESIINDAREFIEMDEWYLDAGIPHRRGYLLHGPPGTGKSSTIYALAGELGMEIYTLSLASSFIDDATLQRAANSIPKHSMFLIEDIDCAFPPRGGDDDDNQFPNRPFNEYGSPIMGRYQPRWNSNVTMSGLLNVLDGVGSEEGKLFFATTNHVDRLDPALIRPGRIDMKVQYNLSNKGQAAALFKRFYPSKHVKLFDTYAADPVPPQLPSPTPSENGVDEKKSNADERIEEMASTFANHIPENEFSTAELQGYLLTHKKEPLKAMEEIATWVERERTQRAENQQREDERKAKKLKNKLESGMGWPMPPTFARPGMMGPMIQPPTMGGALAPITVGSGESQLVGSTPPALEEGKEEASLPDVVH